MLVLVTYDVSTVDAPGRRRLRRVATVCKDYGVRVQKSVFECPVDEKNWAILRSRVLHELNLREDSVRFYLLDETTRSRTEHHGTARPIDLDDPLIA